MNNGDYLICQEIRWWWDKEGLAIPKFEVDKHDTKISQYNGATPCINAFQARYSPIQYYCRLMEQGKPYAKAESVVYAEKCYDRIFEQFKKDAMKSCTGQK